MPKWRSAIPKNQQVQVATRLHPEEVKALDQWCESTQRNRSQALRVALSFLLETPEGVPHGPQSPT